MSLLYIWTMLAMLTSVKLVITGQSTLTYRLTEDQPPGTVVIRDVVDESGLGARYSDPAVRSSLRLSVLRRGHDDQLFRLTNTSVGGQSVKTTSSRAQCWALVTARVLDRDLLCPGAVECPLRVDLGVAPAQFFRVIRVEVELLDTNDNAPQFVQSSVSFDIPEAHGTPSSSQEATGQRPAAVLPLPGATDRDSPVNGVAGYRLAADQGQTGFQLDTSVADQPRLIVVKPLERETVQQHLLTVIAYDGGSRQLSGTLSVTVNVLDVNDHRPIFSETTYRVAVPEDTAIGSTLIRVVATDADSHDNGRVRYRLKQTPASDRDDATPLVHIDSETGDVRLARSVDYEVEKTHVITLIAEDSAISQPANTEASLILNVLDINDNPPTFTLHSDTVKVTADSLQVPVPIMARTRLAGIRTADVDADGTQHVSCRLVEQSNGTVPLAVVPSGDAAGLYHIVSVEDVSYELTQLNGWIVLECCDDGQPVMTTSRNVSVLVQLTSPAASTESLTTATDCRQDTERGLCTTENSHDISYNSSVNVGRLLGDNVGVAGHVIILVGVAAAGCMALAATVAVIVVSASAVSNKAKQRRRRATAAAIKNVLSVLDDDDDDDDAGGGSAAVDDRAAGSALYSNDAKDQFDNVILTLDSEPLNYSARHQRWLSSVGIGVSDRGNDVDSGFADMTSSISSYHAPPPSSCNNASCQLHSAAARTWLPESCSFQSYHEDLADDSPLSQDSCPAASTLQSFCPASSAYCCHDPASWLPPQDLYCCPPPPATRPDTGSSDLMTSSMEGRLPPVIRVGTMAHSTSTGSRKSVRFAEDNEQL